METFSPGSVVQLKCGGPRMVVAYEDEPDRELPAVMVIGPKWRPGLVCLWTVQNALRSAVIAPQALMLAPETPEQATDAAPARKLRAQP